MLVRALSSIDSTFPPIRSKFKSLAGRLCLLLVLALAGIATGCSVQLSPAFDKSTYDSITDLNTQAETLFASLSTGGTAADFTADKAIYDKLIGGFSAARMVTETRAIPPASSRLLATAPFKAACSDDPAQCVNPTPHHLEKVVALLTAMRDTHLHGKLVAALVAMFKNQYEDEMTSVLVFEAALQR